MQSFLSMKRLAILTILSLLLSGCANPLFKPSLRLTKSVLPEYKEYVKGDKNLSDEQKARRIKGVEAYEFLIQQYPEIEGD